jgi:hypothetical protein
MTEPGQLWINVVDDEIIVALPCSTYRATYCKPAESSHLNLNDLSFEIGPRAPMTLGVFLGHAWKAANDRARELGWII